MARADKRRQSRVRHCQEFLIKGVSMMIFETLAIGAGLLCLAGWFYVLAASVIEVIKTL